MISCVETKNGYPAGPRAFAGLGFDPVTAAAFAPIVGDVFKNAAGGQANADFFNYARGTMLLGEQTRSTAIIVGGLVAAGIVGFLIWKAVK